MDVPGVLFIPDRFMDCRMWSDIPDRLHGRARVIHFDQEAPIPWTEGPNGEFMEAGRRLAVNPGFQVVAAAGQAARFGFALAEARQAQGLVFFEPWLDCIPDDVQVDLSGLDETLVPYQPVTGTLDERDSGPFQ